MPQTFLKPFAADGDKVSIPETADDTTVSIQNGFTPIYEVKLNKGGKAPTRPEFNGIFNLIFGHLYNLQIGATPMYDARLNYIRFCVVRGEDGYQYICSKENGPDQPDGVQRPGASLGYWIGGKGQSLDELLDLFNDLAARFAAHLADYTNPHKTTKVHVELGNIPNAVSDRIDLNDSETLATSKAVFTLNNTVISHDASITNLLNITTLHAERLEEIQNQVSINEASIIRNSTAIGNINTQLTTMWTAIEELRPTVSTAKPSGVAKDNAQWIQIID